ncbi:uncharacterized protein LOC129652815 isoform X2 [Bubalus kerabau]|uniref:uncharacterized protein LOC129652815 isoform X2 n=1 Tax=Bubalus carabanensis TaxID=3119969 RepID=UPI00244ECA5D|nr:uncharacterized protein LOC129652815 isoform X2 [Bubalus carabanensis]XP_055437803.1 uncharacterized protein LOC129652815 isoform X2 [Bubalus carabanensis]
MFCFIQVDPPFADHFLCWAEVFGICCLFSRIQADTDLSGPLLDETSCRPYLISRFEPEPGEKKSSSTHQNTDTSFPNQETLTSHLYKPTHSEDIPQ